MLEHLVIHEVNAMKLIELSFVLLMLGVCACSKTTVTTEKTAEVPTPSAVPTAEPLPTAEPVTEGSWEAHCLKAGGRYAKNECEGVDAVGCKSIGGSWNACASPCRHQRPSPDACITVCVEICQAPAGK